MIPNVLQALVTALHHPALGHKEVVRNPHRDQLAVDLAARIAVVHEQPTVRTEEDGHDQTLGMPAAARLRVHCLARRRLAQLLVGVDAAELGGEREVGLGRARRLLHLVVVLGRLLLLAHAAVGQGVDLADEEPRVKVLPVVDPRIASTNLFTVILVYELTYAYRIPRGDFFRIFRRLCWGGGGEKNCPKNIILIILDTRLIWKSNLN